MCYFLLSPVHLAVLCFLRFIYLFKQERARARGGAEVEGDSLLSVKPDAELDPRTQRSRRKSKPRVRRLTV